MRQRLRSILANPVPRGHRTLRDLADPRKRGLRSEAKPRHRSAAFARGLIEDWPVRVIAAMAHTSEATAAPFC